MQMSRIFYLICSVAARSTEAAKNMAVLRFFCCCCCFFVCFFLLLFVCLFVCLFFVVVVLLLFFFAFPSYISGVHHFWVRFLRM